MKLINDFFEITALQPTNEGLRCSVRMNPDHGIYRVHFPGNPITPGVCLVQMAAEILESHYGKPFMLTTLVNIKFKKTAGPQMTPDFVFTKMTTLEDGRFKCLVSVEDEEAQYVKMSLIFNA